MGQTAVAFAIKPARWKRARAGDLRGAMDDTRRDLAKLGKRAEPHDSLELRLVLAFCLIRQGLFPEATRELEAAGRAAALCADGDRSEERRVGKECRL